MGNDTPADDATDSNKMTVDLSEEGKLDADEVPKDVSEISDEEIKEAIRRKREAEAEADDTQPEGTPEGTPDGDDEPEEAPEKVRVSNDTIEQAGNSVLDESDEEAVEEMADRGDVELEFVDVDDDFDYEGQETEQFGSARREGTIEHNGVYFHLEQPQGTKEDKFWSEIQSTTSLTAMFDVILRYGVDRPRDLGERMEEENWSSFAKAGLAGKVSAFLGLDQLQDF